MEWRKWLALPGEGDVVNGENLSQVC